MWSSFLKHVHISNYYIVHFRLIQCYNGNHLGFPGGSVVKKKPSCQYKRRRLDPWVRRILWRRKGVHSSILAWRIPWTEEPGELRSMGSQSVRHSCVPEHKIKLEELCNNIIISINISVHMRPERVESLHEACKPKVWRAWHYRRLRSPSLQ